MTRLDLSISLFFYWSFLFLSSNRRKNPVSLHLYLLHIAISTFVPSPDSPCHPHENASLNPHFNHLLSYYYFQGILFYVFWHSDSERGKRRGFSICWLISQTITMTTVEPSQRQHARSSSLPCGYGDPKTRAILCCSHRPLAGGWIETGTARSYGMLAF